MVAGAVLLALALGGCRDAPPGLDGTWEVRVARCGEVDVLATAGVRTARYVLRGAAGTTTWDLGGCVVEARFELEREGTRLRLHETQHVCRTSSADAAVPCCESGPADLRLEFEIAVPGGGEGMTWRARTAPAEAGVGPWARRGPWRGCAVGSEVELRLARAIP